MYTNNAKHLLSNNIYSSLCCFALWLKLFSSFFSGKWEWLSEAPSLLQPCEGAVSYYSQFGRVAAFTTVGPGRRFRKVLEEHLERLRWPSHLSADKELSVKGEDGKLYHWILPSFFQMLQDLASQGIDFSVLFRTFGTDLPRVLTAVKNAVEHGSHPLFPDLPALKVFDVHCVNDRIL